MAVYNSRPESRADAAPLSAAAIAEALGTSTQCLSEWLQYGCDLGIRLELISPLLPMAYAQLKNRAGSARWWSSRERALLTEDGVVGVDSDDADEHALIDRYWEAVALAALTGEDRALRRFAGRSVREVALVTDLDRLVEWAEALDARWEIG